MRLHRRNQREIVLYAWTGMEDDVYTWGEKKTILAAVYPAGSEITHGVCGEGVNEKYLMLCDGSELLEVGMGVSLDGGTPTLRIVSAEKWAHGRAMLEAIPEGRQMDAI